jgi:hypothetical protein
LDLLNAVRKRAGTRFVAITHHSGHQGEDEPFGVATAEESVTQPVSVELAEAQQFAEAGETS